MARLSALVAQTRRAAQFHAGYWYSEGPSIYTAEGFLMTVPSSDLAAYLTGMHNTWLLMANRLIVLSRKLKDRQIVVKSTRR